jgi:hypothetical protein
MRRAGAPRRARASRAEGLARRRARRHDGLRHARSEHRARAEARGLRRQVGEVEKVTLASGYTYGRITVGANATWSSILEKTQSRRLRALRDGEQLSGDRRRHAFGRLLVAFLAHVRQRGRSRRELPPDGGRRQRRALLAHPERRAVLRRDRRLRLPRRRARGHVPAAPRRHVEHRREDRVSALFGALEARGAARARGRRGSQPRA